MNRVDGKVALVTGAARGLGAATAELLAEAGAAVILTDRLEDPLEETAARIAAGGAETMHLGHDVSREADWERVMAAVGARFGGVDVLVNNAGTDRRGFLEETTLKTWRLIMAVNLDGVFLGIKHGIEAMKGRADRWPGGGSIVNISSVGGLVGLVGSAPYCASKGAVRVLTKAAALECCRLGPRIRVNSVHPGFIETEGMELALQGIVGLGLAADTEEWRQALVDKHPIGRLGAPQDVANSVLYLASDDAAFVTGAEFVVDGGYTAQ